MSLTVYPMTPAHEPDVVRIHQEGVDAGDATFEVSALNWAEFDAVHLPDCRFVADDGHGVTGWVAAAPVSSRAAYAGVVEHSLYVAAETRGRGVGAALLQALLDAGESAGVWTVQASVFPENLASLKLHDRLGFRIVGLRERLGRDRDGKWRDVLLLERRSAAMA